MNSKNQDYYYEPHPDDPRSFQIFCQYDGEDVHAGDYMLKDVSEDEELTKSTVKNLVALLNEEATSDLSAMVTERLYFKRLEADEDTGWSRMLLQTHPRGKAMTPNAVMVYDPEMINPAIISRLCGTRDGGSGMVMPKVGTGTGLAPNMDPSFDG